MEPRRVKGPGGRELGNAAACAEICGGIAPDTFAQYVARAEKNAAEGKPLRHPPPSAVRWIDPVTRHKMWDLERVRVWHAGRPGGGNWHGVGRRAHKPIIGWVDWCPACAQGVGVREPGVYARHHRVRGVECALSREPAKRWVPVVRAAGCPDCGQQVGVLEAGVYGRHHRARGVECGMSGEPAEPAEAVAAQ